jgi:hypothetical protein
VSAAQAGGNHQRERRALDACGLRRGTRARDAVGKGNGERVDRRRVVMRAAMRAISTCCEKSRGRARARGHARVVATVVLDEPRLWV